MRKQGQGREEAVIGTPRVFGGGTPAADESVIIRDDCLLDCQAAVTIGRHAFFGHRVMVLTGSHDMFRFGAERVASRMMRPVVIGEGAWICSGAIICPGVTVGAHAVVGPGAVVMRNVAPYTVVAGNPARVVRRLKGRR